MLYVVEMDFTLPGRQTAWDAWYMEHVRILLSVPGFHTAQRFVCTTAWPAPYLAIYSVDSPQVFDGESYRARGGRDSVGEWQPYMVNWDRNLFAGIERAPAVDSGQALLLTEAEPAELQALGVTFAWLAVAGLDRTLARRGFAVVDKSAGNRLQSDSGGRIRAYRPICEALAAGVRP